MYYAAIIITIAANVCYHVFLKSTPANVNPVLSLLVTYTTAAVMCLAAYPFFPGQETILASLARLNWASYALGLAVFGLEIGFLLAYRAGWNISLAGIVSNSAVALLLLPIGLLFFQEKLSSTNLFGILLCFAGLILINHR